MPVKTIEMHTARWAMGDLSLSRLVHQVRKAYGCWEDGKLRRVHVWALCGIPISGDRYGNPPVFAADAHRLPGRPCPKCAQAFTRRRVLPAWKG